jgi:hypothetical protein
MSRAYRITVAESLSRHVQVDDGVCSNLEMLPILEKGAMGALLAAELEQKGFERDGDHAVRKEKDGITVKVNVQSGEVAVTAEGHVNLNLETKRTAVVENPNSPEREKALRAAAQDQLNREAKAEEEALRRKVTAQLEAKLKDLKDELDGVVNRVTANALKKRASELGTVEEIHEDGSGNMTIKVRV